MFLLTIVVPFVEDIVVVRLIGSYEVDTVPRVVVLASVEPDTLGLVITGKGSNGFSPRDPTLRITAFSGTERSGSGIHMRGVVIRWEAAAPPGYKPNGILFLPVCNPFRYRQYQITDVGTYRGTSVIIVGKIPEVIRS